MWSLVRLKNCHKAIFSSDLLTYVNHKTKLNVAGLDITCSVLNKSDDINELQKGLMRSPQIFKQSSILLHRVESTPVNHSLEKLNATDKLDSREFSIGDGLSPIVGTLSESERDSNHNFEGTSNLNSNFITESIVSEYSPSRENSSAAHETPEVFMTDPADQSSSTSNLNSNLITESIVSEYSPSRENSSAAHETPEVFMTDPADQSSSKKTTITLSKKCAIPVSDGKGGNKSYLCPYCRVKQKKFARHLMNRHHNEDEVKSFMTYPLYSKQRLDIISIIRNRGAAIHNSNEEYHKGVFQVARQQSEGLKKTSADMDYCQYCSGFYTIKSIRNHRCIKKKGQHDEKKCREGKRMRKQALLHAKVGLSDRMRLDILPTLRKSEIQEIVCNDRLILEYGEYRCRTLPDPHNNNYIKSQMTYGAKILIMARKWENPDTGEKPKFDDMASLLLPQNYKIIVWAIKKLTQFEGCKVGKPAVATAMTTLIIKLAERQEISLIQSTDLEEKKRLLPLIVEFQSMAKKEFHADVNKVALNSLVKQKSNKEPKNCSDSDIERFNKYVLKESKYFLNKAKNIVNKNVTFSYNVYENLNGYTLLGIIGFNKKRAGESERMTIEDFKKGRKVNNTHPLWNTLSNEEKNQANKYFRFLIEGKLHNQVAVLLDDHYLECINFILELREQANVRQNNPYIFALPNQDQRRHKHSRACDWIRKVSVLCGAEKPATLRGTAMRKFLATAVLNEGADSQRVESTAKFMGHATNIHRTHYQQRDIEDVARISQTLEKSVKRLRCNNNETNSSMNSTENTSTSSSTAERYDLQSDRHTIKTLRSERNYKCRKNVFPQSLDGTKGSTLLKRKRQSVSSTGDDDDDYDDIEGQTSRNIKRPRWLDSDTKLICNSFIGYIIKNKAPSNSELKKVQAMSATLQKKSVNCLRTYVTRIYKNKEQFLRFLK